jgi:hypothetical protein
VSSPNASDPSWGTDRIEIRDVIDCFAHHADRRQPVEQAAVFTEDGPISREMRRP